MSLLLQSRFAEWPFVADTKVAFADRGFPAKTKIIQKPRPKQLRFVVPTRSIAVRVQIR